MCPYSWHDGAKYCCDMLQMACPYNKPRLTAECVETYERQGCRYIKDNTVVIARQYKKNK